MAAHLQETVNLVEVQSQSSAFRTALRTRNLISDLYSRQPIDVLVTAHDIGLPERAAIAFARRKGAAIALLPDGIPFDGIYLDGTIQGSRALLDQMLVRVGLVAGRRGLWASTNPDLILSWGDGWGSTWSRLSPTSEVQVVGSPRHDPPPPTPPLPATPRVLLCSQPLAAVGLDPDTLARWYAWLESLLHDGEGEILVRLRLHPAEVQAQSAPESLLRLSSVGTVEDDIGWASIVLAPFSTILLEAATAKRVIMSVSPGPQPPGIASNAFISDPRVPRIRDLSNLNLQTIVDIAETAAASQSALGSDFFDVASGAAARAAEALARLARRG